MKFRAGYQSKSYVIARPCSPRTGIYFYDIPQRSARALRGIPWRCIPVLNESGYEGIRAGCLAARPSSIPF